VDLVPDLDLSAPPPPEPARPRRELYIDAFRGLMALVMVQGHVFESLLSPEVRAEPWYGFQLMFHGSTAPGFLFASGFVAGLPRAPLSLKASLRRARRLLFVLGVGYFLHLPWFSLWKTINEASPRQREILLSCDALQVIAVTQLFVILLQWVSGRRWTRLAAAVGLVVIAATPAVWASGLSTSLPEALAPYLDRSTGSRFPVFPYAAFVLAGTLAGATLGRAEPRVRHRRTLVAGLGLVGLGVVLAWVLEGRVDYWGPSPAYVFVRLGGLLLLLLAVEGVARAAVPGLRALALLGHETLLVYVLHLYILFGGIVTGHGLVRSLHGQLTLGEALVALVLMLPPLLAAAWLWRRTKQRGPQQAQLLLLFATTWVIYEFLTRPW
jgi:fucose 4-O-acetylase-like acetyltransferase